MLEQRAAQGTHFLNIRFRQRTRRILIEFFAGAERTQGSFGIKKSHDLFHFQRLGRNGAALSLAGSVFHVPARRDESPKALRIAEGGFDSVMCQIMQHKMRGVPGLLLPGDGAIGACAAQDGGGIRLFGDLNQQHGKIVYPVNRRSYYLLLLCLLAIITYLDRVCISVAGPRMQDALHIPPERWGWVGTAFLLGYALFEIPSGHLGDSVGARKVLTRIVLWWSVFTAATGAMAGFPLLLGVRFLFGAGEAGAFPNASVAISNWFSPATRGRALGLFIMSSQLGGALSPLLVVPIQQRFGWRSSFYVFACLGVVWALVWFGQFRDRPEGAAPQVADAHGISWRPIFRSRSLWIIMALTFGYVYTMGFYQTWFHTYLVKGHSFTEDSLFLSALPYLFGAAANLLGGLACDWLAARINLQWSRRGVGMAGLALAAVSVMLTFFVASPIALILCLSFAYAGITFQQPAVFAACLDMGGVRGGVVSGFMNTAGQVGAAISSAVFGYIVKAYGSYNAPLVPMAVLLAVGVALWFQVDVRVQIEGTRENEAAVGVYTEGGAGNLA